MNEYLQGMQNEAAAREVPFEEPNGWSQMLMNIASTNNSWSAEQAQKQMDFQERMSNTAHQREVADLQAAGLNPVLSAKLGGASTPSGSAATADTSIVSSVVGLMNKMLDVQGTSAAAAYNASGGYEGTYGNNDSGSAYKELSDKDQNSLLKLFTRGQVDSNTSSALKNLWNNAKDNVLSGAEWLGSKIGNVATNISGSTKNAVSFWKDFGDWLTTVKDDNGNKIKTIGKEYSGNSNGKGKVDISGRGLH